MLTKMFSLKDKVNLKAEEEKKAVVVEPAKGKKVKLGKKTYEKKK